MDGTDAGATITKSVKITAGVVAFSSLLPRLNKTVEGNAAETFTGTYSAK